MLTEIKQSDDRAKGLYQLLRVVVAIGLAVGVPELILGLVFNSLPLEHTYRGLFQLIPGVADNRSPIGPVAGGRPRGGGIALGVSGSELSSLRCRIRLASWRAVIGRPTAS